MKWLRTLIKNPLMMGSELSGEEPIAGLTHDAALVCPGSLFFAIRGSKVDGHHFIADAFTKGARAVVVDDPAVFAANPRSVLVDSSRKALAIAASRWFKDPSKQLRVVGVTGTNGKTTTTHLLKEIWDQQGIAGGVIGTVDVRFGNTVEASSLTTPGALELQSIFSKMKEHGVQAVAMEVSSIALDQYRTSATRFDVAIFTNLTQDHLDYHQTFENYRDAKLKLFTEHDVRHLVINIDDPAGRQFRSAARRRPSSTFGFDKKADFQAHSLWVGKTGARVQVRTPNGEITLETAMIGRHNIYNCLGALAASYAMGFPVEETLQALKRAKGAPGRLERVVTEGPSPNVFVDYAHSDDALKKVLGSLHELRNSHSGRIITVFGCGGDRDRVKRPKMADVVSSFSDVTVATSDNPRTEDPEQILNEIETGIRMDRTRYHRDSNRKRAIEWALEQANPEDLVLIAGKGHETYQIIGHEKIPFDDRAVVREYYL